MPSDDRPKVWDVPGGYMVRDKVFIENGYGDRVRLIDAYAGVNTGALRRAALQTYGIGQQYNNTVGQSDEAVLQGGELNRPDHSMLGNAYAPSALFQMADSVADRANTSVQDAWEGDAFDEFSTHIEVLRKVIRTEATRLRRIGDALWELADHLDNGLLEAKDAVAGSAAMLQSLWGLATTGWDEALQKVNILITSITAVADTINKVQKHNESVGQLLADESRLALTLLSTEVTGQHPTDKLPGFPGGGRDDWDIREDY